MGVEAPLVKDRLIFKGTTGISNRKDADAAKDITNLIGDFNLEYKVTGNFRVKVFNQINDKVNTVGVPQEKYTQGIGLQYQEDFNKTSELKAIQGIKKIFKRKKKKPKAKINEVDTEIPADTLSTK